MEENQEKLNPSGKLNEESVNEENSEQNTVQENNVLNENPEHLSSLNMLWRHAFSELDEWEKRADLRDDLLLARAKLFAENFERNQDNLKAITEQFTKELVEWEKTAREEILMSTTVVQHFFPKKSYEELNEQMDAIQKRTMSILRTPFQGLPNQQMVDKYPEVIEQYIKIRKKARQQYIKAVKHAGNIIYENQIGVINFFTRQIKNFVLPFNKYMEKQEEITKS
ncbi:hypothetical protein [Neobacillus endophyticus]|uniref:hypothetical protein n=1 Tax=Neobacillus endophyticus TaxID=2738405 RepID=UPI001FEC9667|nr:hypothetical protein [Neobacillus endophyticus]